jgi:putative hemolysin
MLQCLKMDNGFIDVLVVILLVLFNGFLSMAEMAVVSSRPARLKAKAEAGKKNYVRALEASRNPSSFLSTIQIGITLVGVLSGAFGGATIARVLARSLSSFPAIAPYAETIALASVVLLITFFSIVIGELVPKQLALSRPEPIAAAVVPQIRFLGIVFKPLELLLSATTRLVLRIFRVNRTSDPAVTEEEIRIMIQEGALSGAVEKREHDMVEGVFYLSDRKASNFAVHRSDMAWLEEDASPEDVRKALKEHPELTAFPVCRGGLDRLVGVVKVRTLLLVFLEGRYSGLADHMEKPAFIPETMTALKVFEAFRRNDVQTLFVLDEYGGLQGSVGLRDLVEEIVGELSHSRREGDPELVKRQDGSFLVDGLMSVDILEDELGIPGAFPKERDYNTIAGFALEALDTIPKAGDGFSWGGWKIEIMDMDFNRIDKILMRPILEKEGEER